MPDVEIIETRDGSSSLFLPELNETYHSTHGAETEALYVFIEKGLSHFHSLHPANKTIRILEIGFGTGLNAWLTAIDCQQKKICVEYTSLEKFPLDSQVVTKLNYKTKRSDKEQNLFDKIHHCEWESTINILDQFSLEKVETDISTYGMELKEYFDIIYFDAFAPSKQPEMWSRELLGKMYDLLRSEGVFVTYCAQGQFKRDLKSVGFITEELSGPPGKKEMTRGTKK